MQVRLPKARYVVSPAGDVQAAENQTYTLTWDQTDGWRKPGAREHHGGGTGVLSRRQGHCPLLLHPSICRSLHAPWSVGSTSLPRPLGHLLSWCWAPVPPVSWGFCSINQVTLGLSLPAGTPLNPRISAGQSNERGAFPAWRSCTCVAGLGRVGPPLRTHTHAHTHTHSYPHITVHVHIHADTDTHAHISTHLRTQAYSHTFTYSHMHTHIHIHVYMLTHLLTHIHVHTHSCTHTLHIPTYIHTNIYTFSHTHAGPT